MSVPKKRRGMAELVKIRARYARPQRLSTSVRARLRLARSPKQRRQARVLKWVLTRGWESAKNDFWFRMGIRISDEEIWRIIEEAEDEGIIWGGNSARAAKSVS